MKEFHYQKTSWKEISKIQIEEKKLVLFFWDQKKIILKIMINL